VPGGPNLEVILLDEELVLPLLCKLDLMLVFQSKLLVEVLALELGVPDAELRGEAAAGLLAARDDCTFPFDITYTAQKSGADFSKLVGTSGCLNLLCISEENQRCVMLF